MDVRKRFEFGRFIPRLVRLAVVLIAAFSLARSRLQSESTGADSISIEWVQSLLPNAATLAGVPGREGEFEVFSKLGNPLGFVYTTSPESNSLIGYSGPSNTLIVLDNDRSVRGCFLWQSSDTLSHVEEVRNDRSFWNQFVGWKPKEQRLPERFPVSGSTLTSLAIAEAIEQKLTSQQRSLRFPKEVSLDDVRDLFPLANAILTDRPRQGLHQVIDKNLKPLGYVLRTSPSSDQVRGFQGPTDCLLAIDQPFSHIQGIRIQKSFDTDEYVERVRTDEDFFRSLMTIPIQDWSELDFRKAGIEGVSGATQTSFAVAEGIRRRFEEDRNHLTASWTDRVRWIRYWSLIALLIGALTLSFSNLKGSKRWRWIWQGTLVIVLGIWLGDLLSLALVAGACRGNIASTLTQTAFPLIALAFCMPWSSRRNLYCNHLCPHGVVQDWLGKFPRLHINLPESVRRHASRFPLVLLGSAFLIAVIFPDFQLAWLEPFDAWVLRSAAVASALIAMVGLLASVSIPKAYCRFGCPTGALLKLVSSGGVRDQVHRRDLYALGIVLIGLGTSLFLNPPHGLMRWIEQKADSNLVMESNGASSTFQGSAFGTTWSVRFRSSSQADASLRDALVNELERIESSFSHWRKDSEASQLNQSQTNLAMEYSEEFVRLIDLAQRISRATEGHYDITVSPLVDLWGYGPAGTPSQEPAAEEIARTLNVVGWEKLEVHVSERTIRKRDPHVRIDLGSLLQGYAVDQVVSLLDRHLPVGSEYLVDVGGEMFARGKWKVGIENPVAEGTVLAIELQDQAIATSGKKRTMKSYDGKLAHHFLSPHSGYPVQSNILSCTVRSRRCLDADGWATAWMVSPKGIIEKEMEENGFEVWAFNADGSFQKYSWPSPQESK